MRKQLKKIYKEQGQSWEKYEFSENGKLIEKVKHFGFLDETKFYYQNDKVIFETFIDNEENPNEYITYLKKYEYGDNFIRSYKIKKMSQDIDDLNTSVFMNQQVGKIVEDISEITEQKFLNGQIIYEKVSNLKKNISTTKTFVYDENLNLIQIDFYEGEILIKIVSRIYDKNNLAEVKEYLIVDKKRILILQTTNTYNNENYLIKCEKKGLYKSSLIVFEKLECLSRNEHLEEFSIQRILNGTNILGESIFGFIDELDFKKSEVSKYFYDDYDQKFELSGDIIIQKYYDHQENLIQYKEFFKKDKKFLKNNYYDICYTNDYEIREVNKFSINMENGDVEKEYTKWYEYY